MKYRILAYAVCIGLLLGTTGCGGRSVQTVDEAGAVIVQTDTTTQAEQRREMTLQRLVTTAVTTLPQETQTTLVSSEGSITDGSGEFTYTGELQQIGDDAHGYLQVPAEFVLFQEIGVDGLLQYSDITGTNIMTLNYYEGTAPDTVSQNLYAHMSEDGLAEGLTGAQVQVAGYQANQLYAYYKDADKYLIIWVIPDPEDAQSCYYLAIEFRAEDVGIVACSETFTPYNPQT